MRKFLQQNFIVVIAFSLPILFIFGFTLTTYLPAFFVKTDYNFVYATCTNGDNYNVDCRSSLKERFVIVNNRLIINETIDTMYERSQAGELYFKNNHEFRIFLHDTQTNQSQEITADEAKNKRFSSLLTSPDGITISSDYSYRSNDFFIFGGGSSSYGQYLTKGSSKSKINLINNHDQYRYQDNFEFIGWIVP